MALKPEVSLGMGLATAALVYGIFQNATPTIADIRAAEPGDQDLDRSERSAAWLSAAAVAGVSLLAKDPTVFVVGGTMTVFMAWWTRHANTVDPVTHMANTVYGDVIRNRFEAQEAPSYAEAM